MKRTKETGITLIALVITIIVILLLAGASITMISGNEGILTQAGNAIIKTAHAEIYEEMKIEAPSYVIEKNAKTYTDSFKEYLKSKELINDEGIVDIEKLNRGKTKYGNGTSIESGDVYILEEISDGEASKNNIKEYKLVYYGKTESGNVELGIVFSEADLENASELEYEYLFAVDSNGVVKLNPSYSFYKGEVNLLASKNGYELKNLSLIIPSSISGQTVTSIGGMSEYDFLYSFYRTHEIKKIKIPNTVTSIERRAFLESGLNTIQIPVSVSYIDYRAFEYCDLKNVYYEGTEEQWNSITIEYGNDCLTNANITYNYTGNDIVEYGEETTTKLSAETLWLKYSIWPDNTASVRAFGMPISLNIPSKYTVDGVSYNVTRISDMSGIKTLKSLTITSSIITIDRDAFYGCDALETIFFRGTEEQWNALVSQDSTGILANCKVEFIGAATIGTTQYPDLQSAVNAAPSNRQTIIKLTSDSECNIEISSDKNIILDLNGYTLNEGTENYIGNNGILEIKNGTVDSNNTAIYNCGTTIIDRNATIIGELNNYNSDELGTDAVVKVYGRIINEERCIKNEDGGIINIYDSAKLESEDGSAIYNDGTAVISGGNISTTSKYYSTIENYGTMTISGGTITGDSSWGTIYNDGSYSGDGYPGILTVTGGKIISTDYYCIYNYYGNVDIGENATLTTNNETKVYECTVSATIGTTKYPDVQSAVNAVPSNSQTTIKLTSDSGCNIEISSDKNIILDLNGYTLNEGTENYIGNNGILEIKNGTVASNYTAIYNCGTTIIDSNATINGRLKNYNSDELGTDAVVEVYGTIKREGTCIYNEDGGIINIYDGAKLESEYGSAICNYDDSTLNVYGGVLTSNGSCAIINSGTAVISGGNISKVLSDGAPMPPMPPMPPATTIANRGTMTISGGTITGNSSMGTINNDGRSSEDGLPGILTVTGGNIISTDYYCIYNYGGTVDIGENATLTTNNETKVYECIAAKIGTTEYIDVQAAVNAVPSNSQTTIKLISDSYCDVEISSDKNIILDLNGYKLNEGTGNYIGNNGILEIKNGTVASNIYNCGTTIIDSNATIIGRLENYYYDELGTDAVVEVYGTIKSEGDCIYNEDGGIINIYDSAKLESEYGAAIINSGTAVISGGNISKVLSGGAPMPPMPPMPPAPTIVNRGTMTISGGTITGNCSWGTIYNDGSYSEDGYPGILTVTGGKIISTDCYCITNYYGTVDIGENVTLTTNNETKVYEETGE